MKDPSEIRARVQEASLNFLVTEIETAGLFADIALKSDENRRGYDTLVHYLGLFDLTQDEHATLLPKLESLKSKLQELGETLQ